MPSPPLRGRRKGKESRASETAIEIRRFETPDEAQYMKARGGVDIVRTRPGNTGMQAVFEPGWTWKADEKPLPVDPEACPMHPTGHYIAGKLVVRMVGTGAEPAITAGDFSEIPPGHDAHVDGTERVDLILFEPPADPG